jgi:hypothetical protein
MTVQDLFPGRLLRERMHLVWLLTPQLIAFVPRISTFTMLGRASLVSGTLARMQPVALPLEAVTVLDQRHSARRGSFAWMLKQERHMSCTFYMSLGTRRELWSLGSLLQKLFPSLSLLVVEVVLVLGLVLVGMV